MGYKLRTSSKIIKRKTGRSSNQKYKKFMVFLLSSIGVLILVLAILLITFSHRGFGSAQATATPTVTNTPSPSLTEAMPSPTAFFTILPMGSPLPTAKGATPFPTDMPPLVAVTGNSTMVLELNSVYNESGATAVDNKGSALGVTISGRWYTRSRITS